MEITGKFQSPLMRHIVIIQIVLVLFLEMNSIHPNTLLNAS
jgi:hypothetical protein